MLFEARGRREPQVEPWLLQSCWGFLLGVSQKGFWSLVVYPKDTKSESAQVIPQQHAGAVRPSKKKPRNPAEVSDAAHPRALSWNAGSQLGNKRQPVGLEILLLIQLYCLRAIASAALEPEVKQSFGAAHLLYPQHPFGAGCWIGFRRMPG